MNFEFTIFEIPKLISLNYVIHSFPQIVYIIHYNLKISHFTISLQYIYKYIAFQRLASLEIGFNIVSNKFLTFKIDKYHLDFEFYVVFNGVIT